MLGLGLLLGDALADGDVPEQTPWSTQTALPPGRSPCVHHCAFHVWPLYDTRLPPVYTVAAAHAGAVQVPVEGLPETVGETVGVVPPRA